MNIIIWSLISLLVVLDTKHVKLMLENKKNDCRAILRRIISILKDWRVLISLIIAWVLLDGWSIAAIVIGKCLDVDWLLYVGATWQATLWLPCVPEKILLIPITALVKKIMFDRNNKSRDKL